MAREEEMKGWIGELAPRVIETAGTHTVQLYEDDAFLVDVLARVVAQGLEGGDAVVTIVTPDHQHALDDRLVRRGVDVGAARDGARWVALDAVATLASLTRDGMVDEQRLTPTVGASIDRAAKTSGRGRVRLFGEMVNLLWRRDDRDTALAFEGLWETERVRRQGFSLLCAYPLRDFEGAAAADFAAVCRHHTHVVATETNATLDETGARLPATSALQQGALAGHHTRAPGETVDVECMLCRRVLLTVPRIGAPEAELLAAHLRSEHPGMLGDGPAMLGEILRPMLVKRR